MDLLGSILNAMDKPPTANEEQKKMLKRQKEMQERIKNKQKEELLRFRKFVEERIGRFAKDDRHSIEFQPLDKVHRSIIHEVSEYGGFICMNFGCEDDRYSVVYKKENAPTEDEITARRNGDGWNEEVAKEYAERRKKQKELDEQKRLARASMTTANLAVASAKTTSPSSTGNTRSSNTEAEIKPTFNYKDKYAHLIGQDAALEAARKTETNKSYGFVPSKNKKDVRSIEQTLADIQAKKKLKLQLQHEQQQQELLQQEQNAANPNPEEQSTSPSLTTSSSEPVTH